MFLIVNVELRYESLCSLYDQVFKPSKLPANADFHLFKAGVEPKWEDPECANGGKWTIASSRKGGLDTMWLETVSFSTVLCIMHLRLVLVAIG